MDYRQLAYQTAQKYGIDPDLFVRQIQAESAFRPDAVSSAGAIGLGQLMPATAKELGVDPTDPVQNLEGAARYMKQQLDRFGDPALALAAYNAGPSRVAKANGVPNITETQNYVAKILGGKGGAAMAQEPQQPQGLLGGLLGGQGIGERLGLSPEFSDKLAMAVMAGTGDPRLTPLIQQRAAGMKERRATARTTAQANATADYLERIGQADMADLLRRGGIDAKTALSAGSKDTALIRQAIAAGLKPNTPEFKKYILSGGDIYGTGAPVEFGPLEKGTMLVQGRDEQGNITYQVQPISGSQAEKDAKKAADVITKQTEAKVTSGTTVLGDISEMKRKIEANPTLTTGMIGSLLLRMGFTTAVDVNELGETIRSNIGFDRLQRMREESPTGGALGQVAVQELNALQASLGSLKTSQSDDQLIRNLERLEKQYQQSMRRILETEGGAAYFSQNEISAILGTKASGDQGAQPDFSKMSDAELNAWIEENS